MVITQLLDSLFRHLDLALPVLGAIVLIISYVDVVRGTWAGRWRNSLVTWGIWMALAYLSLAAQIQMGGWVATVLLAMGAIACTAVTTATAYALKTHRAPPEQPGDGVTWQRWIDRTCGVGATVAFVLLLTASGRNAMALTIITDAIAAAPTLVLAWRQPHDSPTAAFLGAGFAAACTILAAPDLSFEQVGYPVYLFVLCSTVYGVIVVGRKRKPVPDVAPEIQPESPVRHTAPSPLDDEPTGPVRPKPPVHADALAALIPEHLLKLSHVPSHTFVDVVEAAWNAGHRAGWHDGWADRSKAIDIAKPTPDKKNGTPVPRFPVHF